MRAAFIFWFVCLVSALPSAPNYSVGEAMSYSDFHYLLWLRLWLGRDNRLLYATFLSTGVGMMLMTGILTAEMLIEGQRGATDMALW